MPYAVISGMYRKERNPGLSTSGACDATEATEVTPFK